MMSRFIIPFFLVVLCLISSTGCVSGVRDHYINYTVSSDACKPINEVNSGVWNDDVGVWYNQNKTVFYKKDTYLKCSVYFYDNEGNSIGDYNIQLTKDNNHGSTSEGMVLVPVDTSFILFQMYSGIYNTTTGNLFSALNPGKFNGRQQFYHVNFYDPGLVNGGCPTRLDFHIVSDGLQCGGLNHHSLNVYGGSITQFSS